MLLVWLSMTLAILGEMLIPLLLATRTPPQALMSIHPELLAVASLAYLAVAAVAAFFAGIPAGLRRLDRFAEGETSEVLRYHHVVVVVTLVMTNCAVLSAVLFAIRVGTPDFVLPAAVMGLLLNVLALPNDRRCVRILHGHSLSPKT